MSVWWGLTPALLEKDIEGFSRSFSIEQVGSDLASHAEESGGSEGLSCKSPPRPTVLVLCSSDWAGLGSHTEEMQLVPGTLSMTPSDSCQ